MWRYRHNFTLYLSTEGKKNIGAASRDKASSVCQPVEKWLVHWLLLCRTLQSWVFVCFFRSFIITIFFLHITGPNVANSKFAGHTPIRKLRIELSDTRKMNNILRTASDQLNASEKKKKKSFHKEGGWESSSKENSASQSAPSVFLRVPGASSVWKNTGSSSGCSGCLLEYRCVVTASGDYYSQGIFYYETNTRLARCCISHSSDSVSLAVPSIFPPAKSVTDPCSQAFVVIINNTYKSHSCCKESSSRGHL